MTTLKRLSDRTSLRTKLITAMLALVIMALAAISITSVVVLRSYLTNQRDSTLTSVFAQLSQSVNSSFGPDHPPGYAYYVKGAQGVYAGLEQPGLPLALPSLGNGGLGSGPQGPVLPSVPTSQAWADANNGNLLIIGARSGPDSWRVIAGPVNYGGQPCTLVVAYDLGPINGEIRRLTTVELTVGALIVAVLAIAGIAVVRANLRPLDDIEMTAGEIAKGHLGHRIPERDPRTEVGRLGRSLNIMLSQVESAFRAQHESERAAHPADHDPRLRRVLPSARRGEKGAKPAIRGGRRRRRAGQRPRRRRPVPRGPRPPDAPARVRGIPDGPARGGPAAARPDRPAAAAGHGPGRHAHPRRGRGARRPDGRPWPAGRPPGRAGGRVPRGRRRAEAAAGDREPGEQRADAHPAGDAGTGEDRPGHAGPAARARRRPRRPPIRGSGGAGRGA